MLNVQAWCTAALTDLNITHHWLCVRHIDKQNNKAATSRVLKDLMQQKHFTFLNAVLLRIKDQIESQCSRLSAYISMLCVVHYSSLSYLLVISASLFLLNCDKLCLLLISEAPQSGNRPDPRHLLFFFFPPVGSVMCNHISVLCNDLIFQQTHCKLFIPEGVLSLASWNHLPSASRSSIFSRFDSSFLRCQWGKGSQAGWKMWGWQLRLFIMWGTIAHLESQPELVFSLIQHSGPELII